MSANRNVTVPVREHVSRVYECIHGASSASSGISAATSRAAADGALDRQRAVEDRDAVGESPGARTRRRVGSARHRRPSPSTRHAVVCATVDAARTMPARTWRRSSASRRRRSTRPPRPRAGSARRQSTSRPGSALARPASRAPAARPRSVRTAGWMPRASSRSSSSACASSSRAPARSCGAPSGSVSSFDSTRRSDRRERHESLLRAVVEVSLELCVAPRPRLARGGRATRGGPQRCAFARVMSTPVMRKSRRSSISGSGVHVHAMDAGARPSSSARCLSCSRERASPATTPR